MFLHFINEEKFRILKPLAQVTQLGISKNGIKMLCPIE